MAAVKRNWFASVLLVLAFGWVFGSSYLLRLAEAQNPTSTVILKGVREASTYTSGASVFGTDLSFTPRNGFVRVSGAFASPVVPQIYLIGASTTALPLNNNVALATNALFSFDVPMRSAAGSQAITYNVRFDTSGTIKWLLVEEYSNGD